MPNRRQVATRSITLVVVLAACASGTERAQTDASSQATTAVRVAATDASCELDRPTVPSGEITFDVSNDGTIVTEVYLYAPHDQVVGEVENVDPGTTGSFTVNTGGGAYEVACKPGQTGDGVRAPLQITGPLDPNQTARPDDATARGRPAFSIEVAITGERFAAEVVDLVVVAGQTITFRVQNEADDLRSFAVLDVDGATTLGRSGELEPGGSEDVVVRFANAGTHTAVDPIADHRAQGSEVVFRVIE